MLLRLDNVTKAYNTKQGEILALQDINLDIKQGEFVCILGPSGCGKTTLLNIIAGLLTASNGKVLLDGEAVSSPGPDRTFIFQEPGLFPWLKVIDNVEFGMRMAGIPKKERREKSLFFLRMVHLEKFQNSLIHELSGGMKQRVAIARALTMDSKLLLMDEPFAAVDEQTKGLMHRELLQIWNRTGRTIIFVTHNIDEAAFLADRIMIMSARPGKIKKALNILVDRDNRLDGYLTKRLKEEVNNFAKHESCDGHNMEEDIVLPGAGSGLVGSL